MTGDDHGNDGTAGRFDSYRRGRARRAARSPTGSACAAPPTSTRARRCHRRARRDLRRPTASRSRCTSPRDCARLDARLPRGRSTRPSSPASRPASRACRRRTRNRTHCIAWSDWATQPKVELAHGIRLDTNYYYWPAGVGPGPPRLLHRLGHADALRRTPTARLIDVYQAATQMTDESGQTFPFTIDTLLDTRARRRGLLRRLHRQHAHRQRAVHAGSDAIVASAQARGVPVVSGRQMLTWLDGRNGSSFGSDRLERQHADLHGRRRRGLERPARHAADDVDRRRAHRDHRGRQPGRLHDADDQGHQLRVVPGGLGDVPGDVRAVVEPGPLRRGADGGGFMPRGRALFTEPEEPAAAGRAADTR